VLDINKAIVVTPGVPENEFSTWPVSLMMQVSGATVSTLSHSPKYLSFLAMN